MTAVVLAVIAALATILAASIPAVLTYKAKGAAESASSTGVDVLAAVHRLEGKVDALHSEVREVNAWRAVHEADHAPPPLVVAPRTARRARG